MEGVEELVRNGLPILNLLTPADFPLWPLVAQAKRRFDAAWGQSGFIREKFNRQHLLTYKLAYVREWLPELATHERGRVLDLGPGFGEFMEICTALGHSPVGVDSAMGEEMGQEYFSLSRMMIERQRLVVAYADVCALANGRGAVPPELDLARLGAFWLVNAQGSIEQILDSSMRGSPLVQGAHGEEPRTWFEDSSTADALRTLFRWVYALLETGGLFTIFFNGYPNHGWVLAEIEKPWVSAGFVVLQRGERGRFLKLQKVEMPHEGAADPGCTKLGTGTVLSGLDQVPAGSGVPGVDDHPAGGNSSPAPRI